MGQLGLQICNEWIDFVEGTQPTKEELKNFVSLSTKKKNLLTTSRIKKSDLKKNHHEFKGNREERTAFQINLMSDHGLEFLQWTGTTDLSSQHTIIYGHQQQKKKKGNLPQVFETYNKNLEYWELLHRFPTRKRMIVETEFASNLLLLYENINSLSRASVEEKNDTNINHIRNVILNLEPESFIRFITHYRTRISLEYPEFDKETNECLKIIAKESTEDIQDLNAKNQTCTKMIANMITSLEKINSTQICTAIRHYFSVYDTKRIDLLTLAMETSFHKETYAMTLSPTPIEQRSNNFYPQLVYTVKTSDKKRKDIEYCRVENIGLSLLESIRLLFRAILSNSEAIGLKQIRKGLSTLFTQLASVESCEIPNLSHVRQILDHKLMIILPHDAKCQQNDIDQEERKWKLQLLLDINLWAFTKFYLSLLVERIIQQNIDNEKIFIQTIQPSHIQYIQKMDSVVSISEFGLEVKKMYFKYSFALEVLEEAKESKSKTKFEDDLRTYKENLELKKKGDKRVQHEYATLQRFITNAEENIKNADIEMKKVQDKFNDEEKKLLEYFTSEQILEIAKSLKKYKNLKLIKFQYPIVDLGFDYGTLEDMKTILNKLTEDELELVLNPYVVNNEETRKELQEILKKIKTAEPISFDNPLFGNDII